MTASLSQNPALAGPAPAPGRPDPGMRADPVRALLGRLAAHRAVLVGYGQLLAGAGGRLGLQAVYFFVLANTLSLAEMGVFASVSAAGVMTGCLAGFGFQSFVMRSAAGRRAALGAYLGAYYICFAAALPLMLGIALVLYLVLFRDVIALPGYLAIILVEVGLWRQIELLVQVNNGLGRFAAASTLVSLPVAFRAAAAAAFWAMGGGDAETWSLYYLAGNAAAVVVLALVFHPRIRLRFRPALIRGRLHDGLLYVFSYFMFLAQGEVDKLVVLSVGGERMAGIYAIAMRLVDFTGVPLRPMFMMYSRKLIRAGRVTRDLLRECLRVEAMVAAVTTLGFLAMLAVLALWPRLLGPNVSTAFGLLTTIVAVPAVRILLEYHGELFFAFGRLGLRAAVTAAIVLVKACAVAALIAAHQGADAWGVWLNAVFLGIYALSFAVVYGVASRSAAR